MLESHLGLHLLTLLKQETTNLLSPNNSYGNYAYGSYTGASQPVSDQDLVREREVLERIVTRATETLIDIMAQNSSHSNIAQNGFGNEDVRVHEYRCVPFHEYI